MIDVEYENDYMERTALYGSREDWLASRAAHIGASEIAGILGISEYKDNTPFGVGMKKLSPPTNDTVEGKPWLEWGHRLEPVILSRYEEGRPELYIPSGNPFAVTSHPAYPLVRGTPDALCFDRETGALVRGVDAKALGTYRAGAFGEVDSDEIPGDYVVQGLIYCEIFDVPQWDFAVLFGNHDYREFVVQRDPGVAEDMIQRSLDWFDRHIVRREPLPLDGSDAAEQHLRETWPTHRDVMATATHDAVRWGHVAASTRRRIKEQTALKQEADNNLRALCGDTAGIEGICTNKQGKPREVTDWKAVAEELRMYAPHQVEAAAKNNTTTKPGSRSLLIKIKEQA